MNTDPKSLRKKVLLEVAASLQVLVPTLMGVSFLLGAWTFSIKGGIVAFVGVIALLVGLGMFLSTILSGAPKAVAKIKKRLADAALQKAEAELDNLAAMLEQDGDDRTQNALQELRALRKIALQIQSQTSTFEINQQVETLFNACIASLKHQFTLYESTKTMARNAKSRTVIKKERDVIIQDVTDSVTHLSEILAKAQTISSKTATPLLESARREMDDQIEVAQRVSEKMLSWQKETI